MTALANSIPNIYDPANVICLISGIAPTDLAPDTMYVLSKEEDNVLPVVGVLGEVAIARNRNNLGTLTISLKQTSSFNQTLQLLVIASDAASSDLMFFPVGLTDPATGMTLATTGWIQNQPDWTLGKEVSQLDWVIGLANVEWNPISQ